MQIDFAKFERYINYWIISCMHRIYLLIYQFCRISHYYYTTFCPNCQDYFTIIPTKFLKNQPPPPGRGAQTQRREKTSGAGAGAAHYKAKQQLYCASYPEYFPPGHAAPAGGHPAQKRAPDTRACPERAPQNSAKLRAVRVARRSCAGAAEGERRASGGSAERAPADHSQTKGQCVGRARRSQPTDSARQPTNKGGGGGGAGAAKPPNNLSCWRCFYCIKVSWAGLLFNQATTHARTRATAPHHAPCVSRVPPPSTAGVVRRARGEPPGGTVPRPPSRARAAQIAAKLRRGAVRGARRANRNQTKGGARSAPRKTQPS